MEVPRTKVGVDNDDVLFDFNSRLYKFVNERYGTNIIFHEAATFELDQLWSCSYEDAIKRVIEFYSSEAIHFIQPMEGAIEVLSSLQQSHDFVVLTSRPDQISELTIGAIQSHFPEHFSGVYFMNTFGGTAKKRTKLEVCQELGVNILMDDHIENLRGCPDNGIRSFLYRRPWNRCFGDKDLEILGIEPVLNWQDFKQKLS